MTSVTCARCLHSVPEHAYTVVKDRGTTSYECRDEAACALEVQARRRAEEDAAWATLPLFVRAAAAMDALMLVPGCRNVGSPFRDGATRYVYKGTSLHKTVTGRWLCTG